MNGIGVLTALWVVPMVGAVAVILLPSKALAKYAALGVSLLVLVLAAVLAVQFDPAGAQFQFVEDYPWIPTFGTGYILGLDGIALALVVLTAVLVPLLIVAGWNDAEASAATGNRFGDSSFGNRSTQSYLALTLAVEAMVLISLMALDVLLFYVFFEAMLIPMYFLIGGFGGAGRSKAAVKFLLYNLFGGLIMLAAVVGLYVATAGSDAFDGGTFDLRAIVAAVAGVDSTAASGSQRWNGHSGAFTANANMKPRNSAFSSAGSMFSSPLATAAAMARKSKVPESKASLLAVTT